MDTPSPTNAQNSQRKDDVLKKIERTRQARRHKFYLRDEKITLSHGSGGKSTHNLIEGVFAPAFSNPLLDAILLPPPLPGCCCHQSAAEIWKRSA